jgi:membrane-associated phospholipid phosphatase
MLWNSGGDRHIGVTGHLDVRMLRAVQGRTRQLSAAVWILGGLAVAAVDGQRCTQWLRATRLVVGAHLASTGVRCLVRRPRPVLRELEPLVKTVRPYSVPSSHAASAVAAAVAFGALAAVPSTAAVGMGTLVMCPSRLMSGVHYPSDVAVGATLGQRWIVWELARV